MRLRWRDDIPKMDSASPCAPEISLLLLNMLSKQPTGPQGSTSHHWYPNGPVPLTRQTSVTSAPAQAYSGLGCVVIATGVSSERDAELVLEVARPHADWTRQL